MKAIKITFADTDCVFSTYHYPNITRNGDIVTMELPCESFFEIDSAINNVLYRTQQKTITNIEIIRE